MLDNRAPTKKKRLGLFVKILLTLLMLGFLFGSIDISRMATLVISANYGLLLAAFALMALRNGIAALRWKTLLSIDSCNTTLWQLTKFYFIAGFFNFFLPALVGGDIARGYYLHHHFSKKSTIAGSILAERILGIATLILLSLISVVFIHQSLGQLSYIIITVSLLFLLGLTLFLLCFERISTYLTKSARLSALRIASSVVKTTAAYRKFPREVALSFLHTIFYQLTGILSVYLISLALHSSLEFFYYLTLLPVVWLISMIPISLNGMGLREGAFAVLFTGIGMNQETAVAIPLLNLLIAVLLGAIGGVFFLREKSRVSEIQSFSGSDQT